MSNLEDLCLAGHVVSSGATWCCNLPKGHTGPHDDGLGDRWGGHQISDEMVDAYVRAHDAVWRADAPTSQGEAVATHRRAVRAGIEAVLDLAHPFMPGGADSTFGAAGTWCAMPVGDDQCGLPPEAHTRTKETP